MRIRITSDSTTDLGEELIERYQIGILPLTVQIGENVYTDGVDVTPDDIYENYEKNGTLPKTASPNPGDAEAFFRAQLEDGYDEIIHFTISSEMSSSYANAVLAAEEVGHVHVVDTRNLSTGGGLLVIAAAEMAEKGDDPEKIAEACRALADKVDASFVIDNLEFLVKGGRCSPLKALGANLLQLKPCICVSEGKMDVGKKYRGKFAAVLPKYIHDRIADVSEVRKDHIFITHAGCDKKIVQACISELRGIAKFDEIHITRAGCTISSHCGKNTLGVLFLRK
ncbi:MAG: DegV family protein [Oscillospiraceae bacterium]|nr:DegV family protein [Oscillospiraceae bacterium]